jgi:hypothetical protein
VAQLQIADTMAELSCRGAHGLQLLRQRDPRAGHDSSDALGFSDGPLAAYLVFVSAQATFIHANVRFKWPWLRWILATPRFHHWHHAAEPEAVDTNFAVTCPCWTCCSARRICPTVGHRHTALRMALGRLAGTSGSCSVCSDAINHTIHLG